MDINAISCGKNPPEDINVIIEVPAHANPIKYEMDKDSGALFVDRFLHTPMQYPCNYGFVPHTLSGDGDPVDVLVVAPFPITPGAVIRSKPIGVLLMEDESGEDEKILAVPVGKLHPDYADINDIDDLPQNLRDQIAHFFEHYKDLEKGKHVNITGWANAQKAKAMIQSGVERLNKQAA